MSPLPSNSTKNKLSSTLQLFCCISRSCCTTPSYAVPILSWLISSQGRASEKAISIATWVFGRYHGWGLTGCTSGCGSDNSEVKIILIRVTKDSSIPVRQECDQRDKTSLESSKTYLSTGGVHIYRKAESESRLPPSPASMNLPVCSSAVTY